MLRSSSALRTVPRSSWSIMAETMVVRTSPAACMAKDFPALAAGGEGTAKFTQTNIGLLAAFCRFHLELHRAVSDVVVGCLHPLPRQRAGVRADLLLTF